MSKSVCVLAPNGRRQTVKVSPHTTILQILEDVCRKQGLNSQEYDIKHFNKILDTTSTILFSGLPNNAQLELSPITKSRAETDVTIALNLESGSRLIGTFKPQNTLWDVLTNLCPSEANLDQHPVVIYTRNEIYGDSLITTSLRSLGIMGGRAMLRLIHRSPEDLRVQPNVSAPLPSKPVEEKPYIRKLQKIETEDNRQEEIKSEVPEVAKPEVNENQNNEMCDTRGVKHKGAILGGKQGINVADIIKQERKQKLEPGVKQESKHKTDGFATKGYSLKAAPVASTDNHSASSGSIGDSESAGSTQGNIEEEFVFLGERNAMLFSLESAESVPSSELPDDFFELTIDDARKILRDIKQRRHDLENSQLRTAAMRGLEESKKQLRNLNRYKKSIIRIQFPNRTVLQGTFLPTDTVSIVTEFVREYLENKGSDFYLYTTPPKNILNKESRLIEVGCVPGAVLHFGTNSKSEDDNYLRSDLSDKFTTNSIASLAANKMRKQGTRKHVTPEEPELMDYSSDVNAGASTSKEDPPQYEDYPKRPASTSAEKVPKWFKPCK